MKIVVLDGYAANPDLYSWDALGALGELTVHERTSAEDVVSRCEGAEIVLTNKTLLMAETIEKLSALRYIGVLATGTNVVDLDAAKAKGITVCNVPAYSTDSVAQLVFAIMLELSLHIARHDAWAHANWSGHIDFMKTVRPTMELAHKTLGIIGYGNIGRKVAEIARAFSMNVIVYSRTKKPDDSVRWADTPEDVFREADVLSLHCPLNADTQNLVNAERLSMMKSTALIINTTRGPVVDERALADALNRGVIAGAGIDVMSTEPPKADNPLLTAKNCVITPHIGWATNAARGRLMDITVANVRAYIDGKAQNIV